MTATSKSVLYPIATGQGSAARHFVVVTAAPILVAMAPSRIQPRLAEHLAASLRLTVHHALYIDRRRAEGRPRTLPDGRSPFVGRPNKSRSTLYISRCPFVCTKYEYNTQTHIHHAQKRPWRVMNPSTNSCGCSRELLSVLAAELVRAASQTPELLDSICQDSSASHQGPFGTSTEPPAPTAAGAKTFPRPMSHIKVGSIIVAAYPPPGFGAQLAPPARHVSI